MHFTRLECIYYRFGQVYESRKKTIMANISLASVQASGWDEGHKWHVSCIETRVATTVHHMVISSFVQVCAEKWRKPSR